MTSLAKQILNNRRTKNCDEFGIPLEDSAGKDVTQRPDYFVARALLLEQKDPRYDAYSTMRLHMREDEIYQHNHIIEETKTNFYRLTGVTYPVTPQAQIVFWVELKRRLPRLNTDWFKVCDGLWWHKKNGELKEGDIR